MARIDAPAPGELTVGVVIPVYRCAPYVRGCLESVLAQQRPADQIVLVDDCGGDDSVAIAERVLAGAGRDYTLIRQDRNGGLGRARNTGLRALTTDLVWFLDSDDTVEPEFLRLLEQALLGHRADFAVCRTRRVDDTGTVLQIDEALPPAPSVPGPDYAEMLLRGTAKGYACTKLFRRETLGEAPWSEGQAYEDIAPCLRLALAAHTVALVAAPAYRYLYRPGSLSTALSPSTFDLFRVDLEVRGILAVAGPEWRALYLGFRYREVLTPVANVAIRADHAAPRRPALYRPALRQVRDGVRLRDVPSLLAGRHVRAAIFAVLIVVCPWLYAAILRWR